MSVSAGVQLPAQTQRPRRTQRLRSRAGAPLRFEVTGWFGRIVQHEYDHLDGYLYVNRLNERYAKRWKKAKKREGWTGPGNSWMPGVDPDPFGHNAKD